MRRAKSRVHPRISSCRKSAVKAAKEGKRDYGQKGPRGEKWRAQEGRSRRCEIPDGVESIFESTQPPMLRPLWMGEGGGEGGREKRSKKNTLHKNIHEEETRFRSHRGCLGREPVQQVERSRVVRVADSPRGSAERAERCHFTNCAITRNDVLKVAKDGGGKD